LNSKKDLEIFRRASQPAPCIAFFDEIDSITLPREGELNMPLQVLKELYHSYSRGDEIQQLSGAVTVTDTCINYMIDSVLIKPGILIK